MVVTVGPWGGNGGGCDWLIQLQDGQKFTRITVSGTECVDGIRFEYLDADGENVGNHMVGVDKEGTDFIIPDGEKITEISGTVGSYSGVTVIKSLDFKIGNKGPSGTQSGTYFTLPVTSGDVSGFFGKFGPHLNSLGVILSPNN